MQKPFGKNLKYYRMLAGMTQEDLAKATGVTRSSVANYEISRSEPEFSFACKAAAVLGIDLNELMIDHSIYPDFIRQVQVTEDEYYLLDMYRKADPVYQGVAVDILKTHPRKEEP